MSNMSYCRFENTLSDLLDCGEHIWDDNLSEEEERARKRMIKFIKKLAAELEERDEEE